MMLVSLMRIDPPHKGSRVLELENLVESGVLRGSHASRKLRLSGLGAKRRGWQTTHQTQAARRQDGGKPAGHLHARPDTPLISGWGFPQTPREQAAEAPEAREPDLHADVGHGMFAHREQISGAIEPGLDSELVRRQTEDRL